MMSDESNPTRHSLLRRLKDWEDQSSWQEFFDTYWRLIYGVAIKAGLSDAEAQEVVQETVLGVAKKIKDFEASPRRGSFKAWLLNLTRWRIADQFRKRKPGSPFSDALDDETRCLIDRLADPATLDPVWDDEWEHNLRELAIENVRNKVDPAYFQIFDLHVLKGSSAKKTGQRLGVSLGQVYFAKYKLSRLIQKEFKRLEAAPVPRRP